MQQLKLFPEDIRIERVEAEANMYRFYRLRLMPDLFGGVSLLRAWGRIGTHRGGIGSSCSKMQVARPTLWFRSITPSRSEGISLPGEFPPAPPLSKREVKLFHAGRLGVLSHQCV